TPVARVVLDLASTSRYHIAEDGDALRVTFGEAPAAVAAAPVIESPKSESPKKVAETSAAPADVPSQVATVAPEATWKMPAEPKPAKHAPAKAVINATADQAPPNTPPRVRTTTTNENVFTEPAAPAPTPASMLPEGTRLLATPSNNSRTLGSTNQKVYT